MKSIIKGAAGSVVDFHFFVFSFSGEWYTFKKWILEVWIRRLRLRKGPSHLNQQGQVVAMETSLYTSEKGVNS